MPGSLVSTGTNVGKSLGFGEEGRENLECCGDLGNRQASHAKNRLIR